MSVFAKQIMDMSTCPKMIEIFLSPNKSCYIPKEAEFNADFRNIFEIFLSQQTKKL